MLFSSVVFLLYFLPVVLVLYYSVGRRHIRAQNGLLLIASLIFYAWCEPKNVLLLAFSCLANYLFGLAAGGERFSGKMRRSFLIVSVIFNLGVLFCFKYLNFAVQTVNGLAGRTLLPETKLALPLGISFFTFQAMSYVIDVYRGDAPVQKNFFDLALYICLFPQLVAGPIVRYNEIQQQLGSRQETLDRVCGGMCRFVQGLAKKLLLANSMGAIADTVFGLTRLWHTQYLVPAALAHFPDPLVPGVPVLPTGRLPDPERRFYGAQSPDRLAVHRDLARGQLDLCAVGPLEFPVCRSGAGDGL